MNAVRSPAATRRAVALCAVLLPVLGACRSAPPAPTYQERMAALIQRYERLDRQKAELWRTGLEPQEFEFEDAGTVTVKRWELAGWPGEVYLKARVHYVNTTDEPRREAFVWLDVLDATGQVVGGSAVRLVSPMGYPFWPGHGYVTEIKAPTNGAHLAEDGFSWTVALEAPVEPDPGPKPTIINHRLENERAKLPPPRERASAPVRAPVIGPHVPGQTRY